MAVARHRDGPGGAFLGGVKLLADQFLVRMYERFAALQTDMDESTAAAQRTADRTEQLERDIMSLRAELPEKYLRREDWIRSQSTIEAKIDGLASKMETAQLRGARP